MIQKKTPDPTKAESSAPNTAQSTATDKDFNARRSLILSRLTELRGRPLACWCKPGCDCHASVLIHMANEVKA